MGLQEQLGLTLAQPEQGGEPAQPEQGGGLRSEVPENWRFAFVSFAFPLAGQTFSSGRPGSRWLPDNFLSFHQVKESRSFEKACCK